ncbi:MAG: hypothetical protein HY726_02575 [Candidatus Rokubacteria bacterium]|nr:hypothetical protein [Candidatus Rokubacteria bacterium]
MAELTKRYIVMAMATEAPFDVNDPDGAFVLKPWKDPAALRALETYRENCYPELARDLEAWTRAIKAGPVVRGGVGKRNEPFVKVTRPASAPTPKAKARPRKKAAARKKAGAAKKAKRR